MEILYNKINKKVKRGGVILRVGVTSTQNGFLLGALLKYLQERGEILQERGEILAERVVDGFFYSSVSGGISGSSADSL